MLPICTGQCRYILPPFSKHQIVYKCTKPSIHLAPQLLAAPLAAEAFQIFGVSPHCQAVCQLGIACILNHSICVYNVTYKAAQHSQP
jgi:hypothetical protein